jgi:G3E family GTPase
MIKRRLPANIYRCKGIVHTANDPEIRYILQVVGRRVDLVKDCSWGTRKPKNRIVAIAHRGSLDGEELTAMFDGCLANSDHSVHSARTQQHGNNSIVERTLDEWASQ